MVVYHSPKDYVDAASSPATSPTELAGLSRADYIFVKAAVAANPATPHEILWQLLPPHLETENEIQIGKALLKNPLAPLELLHELVHRLLPLQEVTPRNCPKRQFALALTADPRPQLEILQQLIDPAGTPKHLRGAIAHATFRRDILQLLTMDPSEKVRRKSIRRLNTMAIRRLFLAGGIEAMPALAPQFVSLAGGKAARIVILLQGGTGSEKYLPLYTAPLDAAGAIYTVVMPTEQGYLDLAGAMDKIRQATGILIGGGHTPTYHRLYAEDPLGPWLYDRYQAGVPIAGLSAGALISISPCILNSEEIPFQILKGLGFLRNLILGVHFSQRPELPYVIEKMAKTHLYHGWGLDEPACAVFEDEQFRGILGRGVYQIEMTDPEHQAPTIREREEPYRLS